MTQLSDGNYINKTELDPLLSEEVESSKHSISDQRALSLKSEISNIITEIEPGRCKPWKFHDRDAAWLTEERCQDLIISIKNNGQIEPILVRKIEGDLSYDYEIIFGVRRWFACSKIPNQKVLARVTSVEDKACAVLMHTENAYSEDITEFERAFSFAKQMKSGIFKNQTEMADMMGFTQGYISKLIKAAEVFEFEWIRNLFPNKLDIPVKYAYELSTFLKKLSICELIKKEAEAIHLDKALANYPMGAQQILKRLVAIGRPKVHIHKKSIIMANHHKPIITCRTDKSGKFSIFIEAEAKDLDPAAVETACVQALKKLFLK